MQIQDEELGKSGAVYKCIACLAQCIVKLDVNKVTRLSGMHRTVILLLFFENCSTDIGSLTTQQRD